MRKIILIYGLIAGVISSAMFLIYYPLVQNRTIDMDSSMLLGYTSMVIALSVIFFGVRTYRDQHGNGFISFGSALKIGILITLVASIIYAATWEVFSTYYAPDFSEFYTQDYLEGKKNEGASAAELEKMKAEMAEWSELYAIPIVRFAMVMTEILPVGLIVSLLVAGILRKRQVSPV